MPVHDLTFRAARPAICRVRVGAGALDRLVHDLAAEGAGRRLFLVSDANVAPLHAAPLLRRLRRAGRSAELLIFPAGESRKTRRTKQTLEDRLFELGADREIAVVAVGGGVTTDLAGFLASTWHRGVPLIHVPTSLLGMVDAAIGGKSGVNLPGGKNLVGTVHQPQSICCDVAVLDTLPERHYREGFAEVVKTAAIADLRFFGWLERNVDALRARAREETTRVVERCVRLKGAIVRRDERESGPRAALNFGHTVAHGLEAASGYRIGHGRAVAIGLCVEADLARAAVGFPDADLQRLRRLLRAFGLPTQVPARIDPAAVAQAARRDKKSRAGRPRFALPRGLGRKPADADWIVRVSERRLLSALRRASAAN